VSSRPSKLPARIGWRDHAVGAALCTVYVAWLLATVRGLGFTRDESFYFRAGTDYVGWFRLLFEHGSAAFDRRAVDSAWDYNHEHPALMKSLFGISWLLLHEKWHVFHDASTAFRFPAILMSGVALWTTYLFGARAWSRRAGLVAAASFGLMPQVFFHAHLACFDMPIVTMWILCVYVHWRAQETRGLGWALATGIVFGLALETKHNAWILPAVLVPHAFFVHRRAILRGLGHGRIVVPSSVVSMAIVGPIVFLALWPHMWNDTLPRLEAYFAFHTNHAYYNMEFLGKNYFAAPSPRLYLPVMVLATVPSVTLLLFGIGSVERAGVAGRRVWASLAGRTGSAAPPRDRRETDLLLALAFFAAISPWLLSPKTPIFGGTKHWMPAYPVLALFAGRGYELALGALRRARPLWHGLSAQAAEGGLLVSVLLAPLLVTLHAGAFGLSTYVPLAGGTAGGADLGLNRGFWGHTTENAAAEYLDAKAPPGATVFIHDTTWDAWSHMQDEGRVRKDLRAVGAPHEAMYSLVHHELHMSEVDYTIWGAYGTDAPAYIVQHDGVPIVSVYRRP